MVSISSSQTARENMRDTSGIVVDRETDFGTVEVSTEKEIKIRVRNGDSNEHFLKDVRFLNARSNFELRNVSVPIILPAGEELLIEVYVK